MKYKVLLIAFLMAFVFSYSTKAQIKKSSKQMERYYRMYVLAHCIYDGFDRDKVFEKDISFSVLQDGTDYVTLNSHGTKLDSLVKLKLQSIVPSQIEDYKDRKAIIFDCLLYYDSKELKKQVREILKSPL